MLWFYSNLDKSCKADAFSLLHHRFLVARMLLVV